MSTFTRSIGVALAASALVLLSACGGGGTDSGATAVTGDPVATFPPLTRTPQPTTETVVVTETVQATAETAAAGGATASISEQVDPELYRSPSQSGHDFGFVSPTGNVSCSLSAAGADADAFGCQARDTVPPEDGSVCVTPGSDRSAVRVNQSRAEYVCLPADSFFFSGMPVLAYGTTLTVGRLTCSSNSADGVVCRAGKSGVRLSREINQIF